MKPQEVVTRLTSLDAEVIGIMPHINCSVASTGVCNCYKTRLHRVLFDSEQQVRMALGMDPF